MKSQDLFSEELIQVFSATTGKYIATIKVGDEMPEDNTEDQQLNIPFEDKNQLKLF
jgi:hypothetical protein